MGMRNLTKNLITNVKQIDKDTTIFVEKHFNEYEHKWEKAENNVLRSTTM